jgi:hypothetical protein
VTTISSKSLKASRLALAPDLRGDTFELRYPRAIHAEFMTHRVFGRNASSSRAIPVKRLIEDVMTDPFIPLHWGKNQKGMQAYEQNDAPVSVNPGWVMTNECAWLHARDQAVKVAEAFDAAGYHKQVINRLLEPWAHINVVATASQLANFFHLRDHPAAEPHIRILAGEMKHSFVEAKVQEIWPGDWHLPYVTGTEWALFPSDSYDDAVQSLVKLSVARSASVSYKTVDGKTMTWEQATRIYDQLLVDVPIHASPAEHQFTCDETRDNPLPEGDPLYELGKWQNPFKGGNLGAGFIQYRKTLANENLIEMPDDILNAA